MDNEQETMGKGIAQTKVQNLVHFCVCVCVCVCVCIISNPISKFKSLS